MTWDADPIPDNGVGVAMPDDSDFDFHKIRKEAIEKLGAATIVSAPLSFAFALIPA